MKKANTNIDKKSLPFSKRVKQVETHISKSIKGMQSSQKYAAMGRMWCGWLRKELAS